MAVAVAGVDAGCALPCQGIRLVQGAHRRTWCGAHAVQHRATPAARAGALHFRRPTSCPPATCSESSAIQRHLVPWAALAVRHLRRRTSHSLTMLRAIRQTRESGGEQSTFRQRLHPKQAVAPLQGQQRAQDRWCKLRAHHARPFALPPELQSHNAMLPRWPQALLALVDETSPTQGETQRARAH